MLYFSRAVGVPLTHTSQSPTLPIDEAQCAYDDGEVVVARAGDLARLVRLAGLRDLGDFDKKCEVNIKGRE